MKKNERVAVLMGGVSSEREVSLRSGAAVVQGLQDAGYEVVAVDVTSRNLTLPENIDVVFNVLHGTFGEDGDVQKILEDLGVRYTGSDSTASKMAFDKVTTRACLQKNGIRVASGEVLSAGDSRTLKVPVVVKPPCEGSSVGCHIVFKENEWDTAFSDALKYAEKVLVEEYISGRELTVGIVGNQVLPVVEIKVVDDWYDYEAKYIKGDTTYLVPAPLSDELTRDAQEIAMKTFKALGASGLGRVDFRLSPEGELFVLELNTLPGFTATSLLPKAAQAVGISFSQLCELIVKDACLK